MNIEFSFQGIHFEWDNGKAQSNYKKYGVLFETACEAFLDPFVKTIDSEYRTDEFRDAIIGMTTHWQLLYVAFTFRDNDIFRIISARHATRKERRSYEKQ